MYIYSQFYQQGGCTWIIMMEFTIHFNESGEKTPASHVLQLCHAEPVVGGKSLSSIVCYFSGFFSRVQYFKLCYLYIFLTFSLITWEYIKTKRYQATSPKTAEWMKVKNYDTKILQRCGILNYTAVKLKFGSLSVSWVRRIISPWAHVNLTIQAALREVWLHSSPNTGRYV